MTQLDRIERKLDAVAELLAALLSSLEDEAEPERPALDLSGNYAGRERDETTPL